MTTSSKPLNNDSNPGIVYSGPGTFTVIPNDFLQKLLTATEEIRDHLKSNSFQESDQLKNGACIHHTVIVDTPKSCEEPREMLTGNQIPYYKEVCNNHERKCEMTREELRHFAAHLSFFEVDGDIIKVAQEVANLILNHLQALGPASDTLSAETMCDMREAFSDLDDQVRCFSNLVNWKYNGAFVKIEQWSSCLFGGWGRIKHFVDENQYTECLDYIVDTFFHEVEVAMDDVCEELKAFEGRSMNDWIMSQKFEDLEMNCNKNKEYSALAVDSLDQPTNWARLDKIEDWRRDLPKHKQNWNRMWNEMDDLIEHYNVVGGDKAVIKFARHIQNHLHKPTIRLQELLYSSPSYAKTRMDEFASDLFYLWVVASVFRGNLYHQKHAFYFREVKKWVNCLKTGFYQIRVFVNANEVDKAMEYVCDELLPELEGTMVGTVKYPCDSQHNSGETVPTKGSVAQELKTFGERSLPGFLVDEKERDTTRFVNITTIATFFSSVTATTLQFTYQSLGNGSSESLRGIVNLFWFLSLVFSVSSGVNSLLGLSWRKSSIYDSRKPPKLIYFWFNNAPMVFLIVAAVAFVLGLNLFAYLSLQPHYVALATNIFTGLHGSCLLTVLLWFVYQLQHEVFWAVWIRASSRYISALSVCFSLSIQRYMKSFSNRLKRNMHLRRNIYWAFGIDSHVSRINIELDLDRDWPEPYLLSRTIRFIVYPIKKCGLRATKALSSIVYYTWRIIFRRGNLKVDIEAVRSTNESEADTHERVGTASDPVEIAESEYRAALQDIFGKNALVTEIMEDIRRWQNGEEEDAERYIEKELWGYPNLVRQFHECLRPILVTARDSALKESEKEDMSHGDIRGIDEGRLIGRAPEDNVNNSLPGTSEHRKENERGFESACRTLEGIYRRGILDRNSTSMEPEAKLRKESQSPIWDVQNQIVTTPGIAGQEDSE